VGPAGPLGSRAHFPTELHTLGAYSRVSRRSSKHYSYIGRCKALIQSAVQQPELEDPPPGIDRKRFSDNYFFEAGGSSTYHGQADLEETCLVPF
jgi:hypothetical protein